MKRTYAEHKKAKDRSWLGKWVLLTGQEQQHKRELVEEIRREAEATSPYDRPSWEVLDGPSATAEEVQARSQTGALFGGARVVVIREAHRIRTARRQRGDEAEGEEKADKPKQDEQKRMAKLIGRLPEGVVVVLVTGEGRDRRKAEVGAALRNAIAEHGLVIECPEMRGGEAAAWAIARAKAVGKKLEPAAARKLVEQKVGTALAELEGEVEKLALFVGERGTITAADVEEVTPRMLEEDVFRLLDAVSGREPGRAVGVLRGLLGEKRAAPALIMWQLAQSLRELWQVKLLSERGWRPGQEPDRETAALLLQDPRRNALARLTGRRAWLAQKLAEQAELMTWGQLASAMQAIHGCDLAMKGIRGKVADDETALELLVIELCTGMEMPVWESPGGERVLG